MLIDEELAKRAKEMNSFSDYRENSATSNYMDLIIEFKNEVEYMKSRHPENIKPETLEAIDYYTERYEQKLAYAINKENSIEAMCSSIMISGGGNFNVRKKEKQNNAREKFWKEYNELFKPTNNYYFNKIKNIICSTVIYSSDDLAIEKLKYKLETLEKHQNKMKEINAYYRKHGTLAGYKEITKEEAKRIEEQIQSTWYKQPYAPFELSNNNAEIRRIKIRIEEITKLKEKPEAQYQQVDGLKVVEDKENMRIRIIFEDIPDAEKRTLLKSNGFKWSPKNSAWQRQLTPNGIYATKRVLKELKGE